jgi:hypothetical protein
MNTVIDAIWQQTEPHMFITREQFVHDLEGWTIEPIERDGVLAFAFLTRGPELHFMTFDRGLPLTLRMFRERLDPLIERYGFACTRTPKDAARQRRFNEAIGCVVVSEDEFFLHYRLENPIWRRRCLS